jgi:hypothetical protein
MLKFLKLTALAAFAVLCPAQTDWITQVRNKPFFDSREYRFTRTSGRGASGDLSAAGANTATLTPGPRSVAGTNPDHFIRISGGVGAAESVQITGGTCDGTGQASCTLTFTTANAHTGAWVITSSSGGIQEAVCALPSAGGEVVVSENITLYANVGKCGKTQPSVRKLAGVSISGSFVVLDEQFPNPSAIERSTGPKAISAILGAAAVNALSIYPEAHDPWPASYGAGLAVHQTNPARLDMDHFFHGIAVDLHTNNPGPINENAAVLGFMTSYGGARPWGGDFHAIVPATATVAPGIAVGVQAQTEIEKAGVPEKYPLLAQHTSTIGERAQAMLILRSDTTSGANFLVGTDENVFKGEGIVLRLADATNPTYRAFAVVNETGTANNWYVAKDGYMYSRAGVSDLAHKDGSTTVQQRMYRVGEPGKADLEFLHFGADVNVPGAFEFTTRKAGAGSDRPIVFSINGTEAYRVNPDRTLSLQGFTAATLPAAGNGTFAYCSDCTIASPCAGGGTGALAKRLNGAWVCN